MGGWANLIVVLLVIGGPIVGQIIQYAEKKRKERQRQRAIEAQQHEALRTGRAPGQAQATRTSGQAAAAARMQELQKRRQQQLEELRRRQQAASQQSRRPQPAGQRPTTQPQARAPQPRPTQTRQPTPTQPPRPTPVGRPTPPRQPQPVRRPPTPTAQPAARRQRPAPPTAPIDGPTDAPVPAFQHLPLGLGPEQGWGERAVAPVTLMGKTMTAADWRRFVVARELLDPPLALRRPGESPFA